VPIDALGRESSCGNRADRIDDLGATPVVKGDSQLEFRTTHCLCACRRDALLCLFWKLGKSTEEANSDTLTKQFRGLIINHLRQEIEELRNLFVAASPVLTAERIHGQVRDADLHCMLEDGSQRLCACDVPFDLIEVPAACPASVPVHDDGDVARRAIRRWGAVH
jgi:hypothetical protein